MLYNLISTEFDISISQGIDLHNYSTVKPFNMGLDSMDAVLMSVVMEFNCS